MKQAFLSERVKVREFGVGHCATIGKRDHYELILVKAGKGQVRINNIVFDYTRGDIFGLAPNDACLLTIQERTWFFSLMFADDYMQKRGELHSEWLEQILFYPRARVFKFHLAGSEQAVAERIFDLILFIATHTPQNQTLLDTQIYSFADLLKASFTEVHGDWQTSANRTMQQIFFYIHSNLYDPRRLRLPVLAGKFNASETYIGKFFKRNTGVSLRNYIQSHRKRLIEKRLKENYSVKELVVEFGLTDESHLRRIRMSGKTKP